HTSHTPLTHTPLTHTHTPLTSTHTHTSHTHTPRNMNSLEDIFCHPREESGFIQWPGKPGGVASERLASLARWTHSLQGHTHTHTHTHTLTHTLTHTQMMWNSWARRQRGERTVEDWRNRGVCECVCT